LTESDEANRIHIYYLGRVHLLSFSHSLIVFPSTHKIRTKGHKEDIDPELVLLLRHYLREKQNAVILLVEDAKVNGIMKKLQRNETIERNRMVNGASDDNDNYTRELDFAEECLESEKLTFVKISSFSDEANTANYSQVDPYKLIENWSNVIGKIKKKKGITRNIIVISDVSQILTRVLGNDLDKLLKYEESLGGYAKQQKNNTIHQIRLAQAICCHNRTTIKSMPIRYLISLLNCHDSMLDSTNPEERTKWDSYRILSLIGRGIAHAMGEGSDKLIFQTLKMIYGLDEFKIVSNPSLFEEKLAKVLGDSKMAVLDSIAREVRQEVYRSTNE
jgi:hypothetical protein